MILFQTTIFINLSRSTFTFLICSQSRIWLFYLFLNLLIFLISFIFFLLIILIIKPLISIIIKIIV